VAAFEVGDLVKVTMPRGMNKRGVVGVSVLYTTWPEAKFDGAVGKVVEVNPSGTYGIPQYLVDFRGQKNRTAIPWQSQWFREEWLRLASDRRPEPVARTGEFAAADGAQETTLRESS
jgi:hypothetical protein